MSGATHIANVPDDALRTAIAQAGLDNLDGAFAFREGDELHKPGLGTRRRTRVILRDSAGQERLLFLKRYGPEPFFRRLRWFVCSFGSWTSRMKSPARVEFDAVAAVRDAGVPTMETLAFGQGCPLADGRSFLLVSAVPGESLERRYDDLAEAAPRDDSPLAGRLADELANLVRTFHAAGLAHRDLYLSHIFLAQQGDAMKLYLIDLARVFRPAAWRRFRWQIKDLAALHYSLPPQWRARHWVTFLSRYLGNATEKQTARWMRAIEKKSNTVARRTARRTARRAVGKPT